MKLRYLVFLSIPGIISGCGSSDSANPGGGSSTRFGITGAVIESLPQTTAAALTLNSQLSALATSGNISSKTSLSNLFKAECYMSETENYCPAGTDLTTDAKKMAHKLSMGSLVGAIFHADMYSGGVKKECGDATATTITSASFVPKTSGGSAVKFILDYFNLLKCTKKNTGDWVGTSGTNYAAFSMDAAGTYQATLTTRYRNAGSSDPATGQSDIFQVYVGLADAKPTILAFNFAGANPALSRMILLVNTLTHKFAVKSYTPITGGYNAVTAVGVGGIDRATGVPHDGYYYARFADNSSADTGCVNNATGTFQANNTPCSNAGVPVGAGWTKANIASYLGLTTDDQTRLDKFLEKLSSDALLGASDSPADLNAEVDQNFPYSITP